MISFTRTGLLPSFTHPANINVNNREPKYEETINLNLNEFIKPAPLIRRPYCDVELINPFTKSCSILCNHPIIDEDAKKLHNITKKEWIKKLNYKWSNTGNSPISEDEISEFLMLDHTDNADQIMVPDILFRRYTQTDSRPVTPNTMFLTPLNSYRHIKTKIRENNTRRCVTPESGNFHTNVPEKKRLVVDLRRSFSQSNLSLEGTKIEKKNITEVIDLEKKPNLQNRSHDYTVDNRHKSIKKHILISKNTLDKNISEFEYKEPSNDIKNLVTRIKNKGEIKSTNSNSQNNKNLKKLKKFKNKKNESRKKINKDSNRIKNIEEADTQVSQNLLDENQNDDGNIIEENNIDDNEEYSYENIHKMVKENNLEMLYSDCDPKMFCFLMTNYLNTPKVQTHINTDFLKSYGLNIDVTKNYCTMYNEISSFHSTELTRTISRRNARFDIPMDKRILIGMKPLEYLKSYVDVSFVSRIAYDNALKIYNTTQGNNEIIDISINEINAALKCAMGEKFTIDEEKQITHLLDLENENINKIDLVTWRGICAFSERIFGDKFSIKPLNKDEDPCNEIEDADFDLLERRSQNLSLNEKLKNMFFLIRNS